VGWAAGIERLAMLVGDPRRDVPDCVVVVEDDALLTDGVTAVGRLRKGGVSAELLAAGSPRKRFDKAVKQEPRGILALSFADGVVRQRYHGSEQDEALVRAIVSGEA
jgi:histidyl-tRNA synthetase